MSAAPAKPKETPQPTGLYLMGNDGKMYKAQDKSVLQEVQHKEGELMGFGIPADMAGKDVPKAKEESDVAGHHFDPVYGYHAFNMWGWVYCFYHQRNEFALHYHPYQTSYCIIWH